MATVCFLDVTYLAGLAPPALGGTQYSQGGPPPLSWWCAGEVAQWASAVALRDAWAATAVHLAASPPLDEALVSPADGRGSYISFNDDDDEPTPAPAPAAPVVRSGPLYPLFNFPTPVEVRNKYFSVSLNLVVGCAASAAVGGLPLACATQDVTLALSQVAQQRASVNPADRFGGVLVADVRQNPAEVPWHVLPRGGACLFRVVMVFLDDEDEKDEEDGVSHRRGTYMASRKEQWQYHAVENGYECVFHRCAVPSDTRASAAARLEAVATASGRRGLLEAPLQGSNRLYQVLCNTLWPAEVRRASCTNESIVGAGEATSPLSGNAFIVVGNNARVVENVFQHAVPDGSARTRRQLRFFSRLLHPHACSDIDRTAPLSSSSKSSSARKGDESRDPLSKDALDAVALPAPFTGRRNESPQPALVLVNKYYAAVAQPRLLQTAYFSPEMQDMLDRYWEQHFATAGASQPLCADAPAIVVWPPSSSSSPRPLTAANCAANGVEHDARSAYPPLEVILETLQRHGCAEVVVVVAPADVTRAEGTWQSERATPPRSCAGHAPLTLSPFEIQICAQRNVEVIDLGVCVRTPAHGDDDAPPVPVLSDEDDVSATRAVDRLDEILHCVQWGRSHPLPSRPSHSASVSGAGHGAATGNSCLLMAYGEDAFQEEEWLREVIGVLSVGESSLVKADAACGDADFVHAVTAAAPTIAACFLAPQATMEKAPFPIFPVTLSNSYFTANVRLHLRGGLWTHYNCPVVPAHTASSSFAELDCTLQREWLELHDGYVIVTSLPALRNAAATVSRQQSPSELALVLSALMRKAAEWISSQQIPNGAACADASADTPLTMLYVTDVAATDVRNTALVDACLCTIAQANGTPSEEEDEGLLGVPLEVVFLGETSTNAVDAVDAWETPVDGLQRLREAFEQQLWPHREKATNCAADSKRAAVPSPRESVAAKSEAAPFTAEGEGKEAETSALPSAPPAETSKAESTWVAPLIGCALPPDYLIDPETLRSVRLQYGSIATAATKKEQPVAAHSGTSLTPQSLDPTRTPLGEQELMAWMEKMKAHGHRLGEVLRREQAATLALALEALL